MLTALLGATKTIPIPTITSFTPDAEIGGQVVIIGTNFTNVTEVRFTGAVASSYTVNSPTQITVIVPAGTRDGPITITAHNVTVTSSDSFTVDAHVYWYEHFDTVTPSALPSGFASHNGTVITTTDAFYTAPNSAKLTGSNEFVYLYKVGVLDTNECCTRVEAKFRPVSNSPGAACYPNLFLRQVTGAPSVTGATFQPGYSFSVGFENSSYLDLRYTNPSNTPIALISELNFTGLWSFPGWYRIILETCESADMWYLSVAGYVQRLSDGAWLQPNGTWVVGAETAVMVAQDQRAYVNGWSGGGFGMVGAYLATGQGVYIDDAKFSDVASRTGIKPTPADTCFSDDVIIDAIDTPLTADTAGRTGYELSKVNAGNLKEYYWSTASYNSWVMKDFGAADVIPAGLFFAPGQDNDSNGEPAERYMAGAVLEAATSSSGPWTLLMTLATDGYPEPNTITRLFLPNLTLASPRYRYVRLRCPLGPCNISVLEFPAVRFGSQAFAPTPPGIIPASGRYPVGTTFTLIDLFGIAVNNIYYTLDGTDPVLTGGIPQGTTLHYTGPVVIPSNGPSETIVKAVHYLGFADQDQSEIITAVFVVPGTLVPDTLQHRFGQSTYNYPQDMYDNRGVLMNVNTGHISLDTEQTNDYYWIGQTRNGTGLGKTYLGVFHTPFFLYRSSDLKNWTYIRQILFHIPTSIVDTQGPLSVGGRPVFFVNPAPSDPNKQYLLFFQVRGNDVPSHTAVLSAPTMEGPYTYLNCFLPADITYDSWTIFHDTEGDGSVWLAYPDIAYRLDPDTDYSTILGSSVPMPGTQGGGNVEAPCVFIRGGIYFFIDGLQTPFGGSSQNGQRYYRANSFLALGVETNQGQPWLPQNPGSGQADRVAYNVQFGSIALTREGGIIAVTDIQAAGISPVDMSYARPALFPIIDAAFPAANQLKIPFASYNSWDPETIF